MAADDEEAKDGAPAPKSKKGLILGVLGGVIVLVGGAVGGAMLAPKLAGAPADAQAAEVEKPPETVVSSRLDPIIVDIRNGRGSVHHLKVGLAVELKDEVTEEEFKLYEPRGRAAALTYLRTLSFKDATDPMKYEEIQKQLADRVMKAIGEDKLTRVLLIDFVAQ